MTENKNMELWNKVKQPPPIALKQITGGRLKNMSDISPNWRYQVMTEVFGKCGEGWKYTIDKLWTEPAFDGQVFAFALVSVYYKVGNILKITPEKVDELCPIWSEQIQGVGGSMLIQKESAGLHSNDEAYKMAVTDALGTAMKMIGVAADIYAGKWDGSKYRDEAIPEKSYPVVDKSIPKSIKVSDKDRGIMALERIDDIIEDYIKSNKCEEIKLEIRRILAKHIFQTGSRKEVEKMPFGKLEHCENRIRLLLADKENIPENILQGKIKENLQDILDIPDEAA